MYRQCENICVLENLLEEAKKRLAKARRCGRKNEAVELEEEVCSLEEKLNVAWQCDETMEYGY